MRKEFFLHLRLIILVYPIAVIKLTRSNLGDGSGYMTYASRSQSITEGNEGGTQAGTRGRNCGETLLSGCRGIRVGVLGVMGAWVIEGAQLSKFLRTIALLTW
jgi:hypothetical protein